MGIRGRLLVLALGVALPLTLLGLAALWRMWTVSRAQLEDSLAQQAELASVAFEGWIDAQRQPLATIAASVARRRVEPPELEEDLRLVLANRPHWVDLRILDPAGDPVVAAQPDAEPLRPELIENLSAELRRRRAWALATDWTKDGARPLIALAEPIEGGASVVARVDGRALGDLFRDIELSPGGVIAVFDRRRRLLYRSLDGATSVPVDRSSSALFSAMGGRCRSVVEAESPSEGVRRVYALACAGATDCVVMIGVPSAALYEPAQHQLARFGLFSLVALACAVGAALIIARGIARPVWRLGDAARRFGSGDLTARAPLTGGGEISDVGAAFNAMAEQVEEREERLTELDRLKSEFVSGVSHELRTPLTTIKTLTRVLLRGDHSDAERREYLEAIAAECNRQIELVVNLLDLSRIESGAFRLTPTAVDVAEVVRECIATARHAADAQGQDLRAELPADLPPVMGDPAALRRALFALVENAAKYTTDGGRIALAARATGDEVEISVTDSGRGIAPEDLPHLFERFYRGRPGSLSARETSPGRAAGQTEAPGVGLGLYLARTIVEQLGGRIRVESTLGQGSTFTIHLRVWRGGGVP